MKYPTDNEAIDRQTTQVRDLTALRAQQERARREAALQAIRADLPRALARCYVPPILRNATLNKTPDLPVNLVDSVRVWTNDPQGFLVLLGPPGAGKSYLAAASLAAILSDGLYWPSQCFWRSEPDFLGSVEQRFGVLKSDPRPAQIDLLILDDLGAGYVNDMRLASVEKLVRARYATQRPTIITSNLDLDGITARYGGRVTSVIQADRQVFQFPSRDLRLCGNVKRPRPKQSADGHPT